METAELAQENGPKEQGRRKGESDLRSPVYDLADSVEVAEAIHQKAGGIASRDQLAAFLGYKSTNSGSYLARMAAARLFGLVGGRGDDISITPLAQRILMPVYPSQRLEALIEAFLSVPLFKAVFEEFRGKELPSDLGLNNYLRTRLRVPGDQTPAVIRVMMNSADVAGFFSARGGARTHLILPKVTNASAGDNGRNEKDHEDRDADDRGDDGGRTPPPIVETNVEQVRLEYIRKLISLLGADEAADDKDLMDRIERLIQFEAPGRIGA